MAGDDQQSAAGAAVQQVQEKGGQAVGKAQEVLGAQTQSAKAQAAGRVRQEVEQRSTQAGEQAQSLATAMRRAASQLREQGDDRQAGVAEQAADRVERAAAYLRDSHADRILGDVEAVARRRPWLVGLAAAGVGFFAARFLTASSASRYSGQRNGARDRRADSSQTTPSVYGAESYGAEDPGGALGVSSGRTEGW